MFLIRERMTVGYARFSPRVWGCFVDGSGRDDQKKVFPTCVGMFLILGIAGLGTGTAMVLKKDED